MKNSLFILTTFFLLIYQLNGQNVGIGTTNPTGKLQVNGLTRIGGLISIFDTGGSVFVGAGAGVNDDFTNNANTAIGDFALSANQTGVSNVALGNGALQYSDGNADNVALGRNAIQNKTSGNFNVGIGHSALQNNISGSGNVAIGRLAGQNETGSNKLYIENSSSTSPLIYGEFNNDFLKINGRTEVTGKIKVGDDASTPAAGSIRYNTSTQDFEGYDGSEWKSFTDKIGQGPLGSAAVYHLETDTSQISFADFAAQGESIAISGDIMVVGAPNFDDNLDDNLGTGLGTVAVYKKTSGSWGKILVIDDPASQVNSRFGYSVETDGNYIIVGSPGYDNFSDTDEGRAYVYTRGPFGFTWPLTATLTSTTLIKDHFFGDNMQLDGSDIIVGAPGKSSFIGFSQLRGRAFIFHFNGGNWIEQIGASGSNFELGDGFGADVAIDGDYAVIGAPEHSSEGNAYIFQRTGVTWNEVKVLNATNSPGFFSDDFGHAVAIRGTDVVVSAPFYQVNGNDNQGQIFGYEKVVNNWLVSFTETAPEQLPDCRFGNSLRNFNDRLIVSSNFTQRKFHTYTKQGAVYNYESSFLSKKLNDNYDVDISNNIIVALDKNFQQQQILYYE